MNREQLKLVTDNIVESLDRYVQHRIEPGGFLTAVLENNLRDALGKADHNNRRYIFEIVSYCYNYIPGNCWGSPEAVDAWLATSGSDS